MRYEIAELDDGMELTVREVGERARVLESMRACQEGRCACPTDQYDRLEGMDIRVRGDTITVDLRPRAGEQLDVDELRGCLDHTVAQAE